MTGVMTRENRNRNRRRRRYGRWGIWLESFGREVEGNVGWVWSRPSSKERERVSMLFDPWHRGIPTQPRKFSISVPIATVFFSLHTWLGQRRVYVVPAENSYLHLLGELLPWAADAEHVDP